MGRSKYRVISTIFGVLFIACIIGVVVKLRSTGTTRIAANPIQVISNVPKTIPSTDQSSYDHAVLGDHPVAFWAMSNPGAHEADLTGNGHTGTYKVSTVSTTSMPDGESAVVFNKKGQFLTVPSNTALSVSTTKELTWEGWVKPSTLQFSYASSSDYVEWMGKCQNTSSGCEWAARMYSVDTSQGRCSRLSAYVFNSTAGLGSGAFWQPTCGLLQANQWLYVVGEYDASATATGCDATYPGTINIWVDGIEWNQSAHAPTGCMSQYKISPVAGDSPLNIGTVSLDTWFQGAIGKVAIYNYLLSTGQIQTHFRAMTGESPNGYCSYSCSLGAS